LPSAGQASGGPVVVPDVRCAGAPDAGPAGDFHHFKNDVISLLGDPKHRGFDLVASASAATQTLEGWISYTIVDKALEDEDVDVFACRAGQWRRVGTARTDDEGHFALALSADDRLPIGMRDLFVSVVGDRTGVGFLGYVAPEGSPLLVSDVDGTLTSSENAFLETIVLGIEPGARAGAPHAFAAVAAKGIQPVYVTARGNQYTTATREWLEHKGFPRGPVRLSPSFVTLPGGDTIDYKTQTISALSAAGLALRVGVGNRASDVTAYASTGVADDRIFIELPDYASEVQPMLDAHRAIGFTSYDDLLASYLALLP
jgi:phosphatidate phosphatase PAH1